MKKKFVWIIVHHEFYQVWQDGKPVGYAHDGIVMHMASSLKKAEKYIESVMVDRFSWWGITRQKVDDTDFTKEGENLTRWYTCRGVFVSTAYLPPARIIKRAEKWYKKEKENG